MRTFLAVALFEIKTNINEKYTLFMFIGLPILLTLILGTTFDSLLNPDMGLENKYLLYVEEGDPVGEGLLEYLNIEEIKHYIQYEQVVSPEEAIDRHTDEAYMGYIIMEPSTGEKLFNNEPVELSYMSKYNSEIIKGVLGGFVEAMKMYVTMLEDGVQAKEPDETAFISRGAFNEGNTFPKSIDYYAVQSLIQMLVFAAILGSNTLTRDYDNDVFIRIKTAPISKAKLIFAKIVGNVVYVTVAAVISLLVSGLVFGANIYGNFPLILLTIMLFAFAMIGIGIIIGSLVKNLVISVGITVGMVTFFSGVSGGMTPEASSPFLQIFTPNYYAKNIIFGSIYDYDASIIGQSVLALFVGIAIVYTAAILLQRRKMA